MTPVEVTVVIPFDWLTGILVPAASILVSAGIAIWLARRERHAAEEDRVGAAASRLVRSLTAMSLAAARRDQAAVNDANALLQGDLNEFSVALDASDADVAKYVAAVIALAFTTGDADVYGSTSTFLVGCIEGWVRGQQPTSAFTRNMPPDADSTWVGAVRLDEWRSVTTPDP